MQNISANYHHSLQGYNYNYLVKFLQEKISSLYCIWTNIFRLSWRNLYRKPVFRSLNRLIFLLLHCTPDDLNATLHHDLPPVDLRQPDYDGRHGAKPWNVIHYSIEV